MHRLVAFSLDNKFLVLILTAVLVGFGVNSMLKLPIDAVPDVTPNQVLVLTRAPGLGPVEVENFVTFPVETAMSGLPGITDIRSVSRFGLSSVSIYFEEGLDIYFVRRLVMERLPEAREAIPEGFGTPSMGPISTGLGEIFQFEVAGEGYSAMELRSILDWDIGFKLRSVPGVVEVNAFGGELKTYEVQIDPDKLVAHNVSLDQVFQALEANNRNAGGAYIERAQEQYVIRGEGLVERPVDVDNIVVAVGDGGTPVYIKNLGTTVFAPKVRQGAVTRDGRGEVVTGVVLMLMGENSRVVAQRVKDKLEEIKASLPPRVQLLTYYDRTDLVKKTIKTVSTNLVEGGLLVVAVLLLLLGNVRGGLIVASAIPLSMLFAFTGMVQFGLSGNLMSLGAIDFGLIVDGSVVMIENIVRRLSEARDGESREELIREAGQEVARPIFFAVLIIIIVYLPILALQGVEGKMFKPMAITVVLALVGSLVLALTVMPVFAAMLFRRAKVSEKEPRILHWLKERYRPMLMWTVARPGLTGAIAAAVFVASLVLVPFMGSEFIPKLDEGTIAIQAWRLPSVALSESVKSTTQIETVLKRFPEVTSVISRTGQAEIPTDPMGVEVSDIYVLLTDHSEWTTADSREGLVEKFNEVLEKEVPGNAFSYSQPIELRVQELIAGVRSDLAVTLYGEDLEQLRDLGGAIVAAVAKVPGAADVKLEQTGGLPYMRVRIKRDEIARYGINVAQVLDVVQAIGGRTAGQVLEGQRRFELQVRFAPNRRNDVEAIRNLKVQDPAGRMIPLSQLADIVVEEGPAQISRENIHRKINIEANVRGRDLGGFVADVQRAMVDVKLPPGYYVEYGGQFENLQRASNRLLIVVPIALFLIFVLLFATFNAIKPSLLIYFNIPIAATGGVVALMLRGMPFSISAGVGFIALFGIAVLNGVVMVSYFTELRQRGRSVDEAVQEGAMLRLRPVLMTALVAGLGFIPMALATSAGAEVQRPLATVVIGGLLTSTPLTLLVLPALYRWFERREPEVEL